MTNYIEISHSYKDEDDDVEDTYYAVCPTPYRYSYKAGDGEVRESNMSTSWDLMGGRPISIYHQDDIDGLRKLLDAVEAELKKSSDD